MERSAAEANAFECINKLKEPDYHAGIVLRDRQNSERVMAQQLKPDQKVPGGAKANQPLSRAVRDDELRPDLPPTIKEQPDPFLQMSSERMGAGGITLITLAAAIILGVVLFGLNSAVTTRARAPLSPSTTPAAAAQMVPVADPRSDILPHRSC